MQVKAVIYCRSPGVHTVLGPRDEHDGVCGLLLFLSGLGLLSLKRVESLERLRAVVFVLLVMETECVSSEAHVM